MWASERSEKKGKGLKVQRAALLPVLLSRHPQISLTPETIVEIPTIVHVRAYSLSILYGCQTRSDASALSHSAQQWSDKSRHLYSLGISLKRSTFVSHFIAVAKCSRRLESHVRSALVLGGESKLQSEANSQTVGVG